MWNYFFFKCFEKNEIKLTIFEWGGGVNSCQNVAALSRNQSCFLFAKRSRLNFKARAYLLISHFKTT